MSLSNTLRRISQTFTQPSAPGASGLDAPEPEVDELLPSQTTLVHIESRETAVPVEIDPELVARPSDSAVVMSAVAADQEDEHDLLPLDDSDQLASSDRDEPDDPERDLTSNRTSHNPAPPAKRRNTGTSSAPAPKRKRGRPPKASQALHEDGPGPRSSKSQASTSSKASLHSTTPKVQPLKGGSHNPPLDFTGTEHIQVHWPADPIHGTRATTLDIRVGSGVILRFKDDAKHKRKLKGSGVTKKKPYQQRQQNEDEDFLWFAQVTNILPPPHHKPYRDGAKVRANTTPKARIQVRFLLRKDHLRAHALLKNIDGLAGDTVAWGLKEVIVAEEWIQSSPMIEVDAILSTFQLLYFDDGADLPDEILTYITRLGCYQKAPDPHLPLAKEIALVSAGTWTETDPEGAERNVLDGHIMYARSSLLGFRTNWDNKAGELEAVKIATEKSQSHSLNSHCTCGKPYDPELEMRLCQSSVCRSRWYHEKCIEEQGLEGKRAWKTHKASPSVIPIVDVSDAIQELQDVLDPELAKLARRRVIRGGAHGLVGNSVQVAAARTLVRGIRDGDHTVEQANNSWRDSHGIKDFEEELCRLKRAGIHRGAGTGVDEPEDNSHQVFVCPCCFTRI